MHITHTFMYVLHSHMYKHVRNLMYVCFFFVSVSVRLCGRVQRKQKFYFYWFAYGPLLKLSTVSRRKGCWEEKYKKRF